MKLPKPTWWTQPAWSGWGTVFLVSLFVGSRFFVLTHPPYSQHRDPKTQQMVGAGYSDVQHDSERYANMWHYGLTPYRKHLFEYPPGAIPLMYVPLLVDQAHIGHYYLNYRVQIFLLESVLFAAVLLTLNHLPLPRFQRLAAVLFYIVAGAWAKDFWYDGLDLVFLGTLSMGLMWRLWFGGQRMKHRIVFWSFFWWSVAVKLLTVPLLLPLAFLGRKSWKKEVGAIVAGFVVIWGVPLVLYRSSLSVFLFFHATRPFKLEAFPAMVVRLINDFTHSEVQSDIAPHFPVLGPVSTAADRIVAGAFPAAVLVALFIGCWWVWKYKLSERSNDFVVHQWLLKITLTYLWFLFLSSKIFSRPFHIWYVLPMVLYPFSSKRWQVFFICCALLMLGLDTTPYLKVPQVMVIAPITLERIRDMLRFLPMLILLPLTLRLPVWTQRKTAQPDTMKV